MEADVFEEQDVAIGESFAFGFGVGADTIGGEGDRSCQKLCELLRRQAQAIFWVGSALRPAEMRSKDQARAAFDGQTQRGQRFADARVVGDLPPSSGTLKSTRMKTRLPVMEVADREFVHGELGQMRTDVSGSSVSGSSSACFATHEEYATRWTREQSGHARLQCQFCCALLSGCNLRRSRAARLKPMYLKQPAHCSLCWNLVRGCIPAPQAGTG